MANKIAEASSDSMNFLAAFASGGIPHRYEKDKVIYAQAEPAGAVFFIQHGQVKISVASEHGKEAVVAVLGAGAFFGEGCLIGQPTRLSEATAMTACAVMRVEKAQMIRALRDEPALAEMFITHLLARNSRTEEDLIDQLFNSSEKRLARVLLLLSNIDPDGRSVAIMPRISQATLAEMIGTTRPRVSFFMNKFRKLGFIEYNGHLKVHPGLLSVVANG
jgi:CRP-like cAMP-binding protein